MGNFVNSESKIWSLSDEIDTEWLNTKNVENGKTSSNAL